jgi:hypothetical protein
MVMWRKSKMRCNEKSRKRWSWAAFCVIAAVGTARATAATFEMYPSVDAFVASGANAGKNFGAAGALEVAASGLPKGEFQTVLRFDAAPAIAYFDSLFGPGHWTVQNVSLGLSTGAPNNPVFNSPAAGQLSVAWMQNDTWLEGTGTGSGKTALPGEISFSSLPSFLSSGDRELGTFNYDGSSGANTLSLGLAPELLADVSAGNLVGLRMYAPTSSTVSCFFHSRSYDPESERTVLVINAVPEPATVWLLLCAGALAGSRGTVRGLRCARSRGTP